MKSLNIGLFGYGTVGRGLHDVLTTIKTVNARIKRVCVVHLDKHRNEAPDVEFTDNPDDIYNDPEINLIVELIDDADAAYDIVVRALKNRIPVVTGNKKMLAAHIEELIEMQRAFRTPLLYDASACGSIPVIRNLEEYYDNDLLVSVKGILNGSSNFILTRIFKEKLPYAEALKMAQDLGFAESNPTLDVDGWDSLYKLIIITVHAFGVYVKPENIFTYGISTLNDADIRFARERGRRIKLVGHSEKLPDGRLIMSVMPQLLSPDKYIYGVDDEFNGVVIKGHFYGKQFMFGRGAGGHPTGSSVLSDITACSYNYRYEYKKLNTDNTPVFTNDVVFRAYFRYRTFEQRAMVPFKKILEQYTSDEYNYIVGEVSLADLKSVQEQLRIPDCFIAAYPRD